MKCVICRENPVELRGAALCTRCARDYSDAVGGPTSMSRRTMWIARRTRMYERRRVRDLEKVFIRVWNSGGLGDDDNELKTAVEKCLRQMRS